MIQVADEDGMRIRILEHVQARPGDQAVIQVWEGYLAALLEYGILEHPVYQRLVKLLPATDKRAILEVFLTPEYIAIHPELLGEANTVSEDEPDTVAA